MLSAYDIMPCPLLRPFVQRYWVLAQDGTVHFSKQLLPTGHTKWMFLRKGSSRARGFALTSPMVSVCGPYGHGINVSFDRPFEMITVFFNFHSSMPFTGVPSEVLADRIVDFDDMEDGRLHELKWRVLESDSANDAVCLIESFLMERLPAAMGLPHISALSSVVRSLDSSLDRTVRSLAEEACMSERQFLRVFTQHVGLSPKQFMRIRRLVSVSSFLMEGPTTLTEAVYSFGYTDHSHLDKDFRHFASMPPSSYLSSVLSEDSQALMSYYSAI